MAEKQPISEEGNEEEPKKEDVHDILPLIYILLKNPPPDHDFKTCPIARSAGSPNSKASGRDLLHAPVFSGCVVLAAQESSSLDFRGKRF